MNKQQPMIATMMVEKKPMIVYACSSAYKKGEERVEIENLIRSKFDETHVLLFIYQEVRKGYPDLYIEF